MSSVGKSCVSIFAALELTCYHIFGVVCFAVIASVLVILALAIVVPFQLLALAILYVWMKGKNERWKVNRLESNRHEDIISLCVFKSLAATLERELHVDEKAMALAARGRSDLQPRLRRHQFARVWEGVADRSVTKPEDVHYILGTLNDLRIQPLKDLNSTQRLNSILRSFDELPLGIIFPPPNITPSGRSDSLSMLPSFACGDNLIVEPAMYVCERGFNVRTDEVCSIFTVAMQGCLTSGTLITLNESENLVVYRVTDVAYDSTSSDSSKDTMAAACIMIMAGTKDCVNPGTDFSAILFDFEEIVPHRLDLRFRGRLNLRRESRGFDRQDTCMSEPIIQSTKLPSGHTCTIIHDWTSGINELRDTQTGRLDDPLPVLIHQP